MKDILVLAADIDMQKTLETLLSLRTVALHIKKVTFKVERHPGHDSGVYSQGLEFLRVYQQDFRKFILIFDHEGCNSNLTPEKTREALLRKAPTCGFTDDNIEAIVIAPELELWTWKSRSHLAQLVRWKTTQVNQWLQNQRYQIVDSKPVRPKEAYERLLKDARIANSSSNFRKLASKISVRDCKDPAFKLLVATLDKWFGI